MDTTARTAARLVDRDVLAAMLGVHPRTVARAVARGDLPFFRVGRVYKFDVDEVLVALRGEAHTDRPTSPPPAPEGKPRGRAATRPAATVAALRASGGDLA